jgi:hypothetical protein
MSEAESREVVRIAGSSIIDVRMWFDESPWRVAAGWTVLAAVLASGLSFADLLAQASTVALLFLLADPLWGSIWGLMSTPDSLPTIQRSMARSRVWLPYLRSGSPAARLFGMDGPSILALVYKVALPAIFLALVVSFILDPVAPWLTLALIFVSTAGWLHQQIESIPVRLLFVLATVALPWLLVALVLGEEARLTVQLLLAGLWALHVWGSQSYQSEDPKMWGVAALAVAQAGIGLLLIFLQLPIWLIFLALFFLPTWLALYRGEPLERVRFWWVAALLISGLALGQVVT